ncbi:restriction endonuclease subunit S [Listeria monocytogenes]|nr:restriction endonuclease subunit S [Listeria monocytogenes]EAA0412425.1 restriction endonuclease subunit S [Listeria monocytogenes]EAC5434141.1 restriction endonuclease subunit S [Listeria monocytogenes]EAC9270636.1 restriction endonuclease subunit S [Listeria monocytogenes]EAC9345677.1 restriction endonuclease subunit S [Listeria monocytogenes]
MSNDTQPEIRFPGFTDDWEQRKLGELIDIENGYAFKSEYFIDEKNRHIVLTPGSVKIGGGFQKGKGRYYDISGVFPEKFIFKPGNIFITMTDLTPTAQSLGYPAIVPNDDNVYLHNQRLGKIVNSDINQDFLYTLLTTDTYHKEVVSSASGTTVKHSSVSKILDFKTAIPNIEEQQKIGSFFKQLDNTIALHQRKLDLLKETKKGFLQKMFPKNGAKVPEIRFPGFTEDWEERRLQEVVDRYDNLRIPITASKRVAGNTPYYGANGIQGYVEGYTHDGEFILVAEDGANDLKNYPVQYVDGKVWVNNHAHVIQAKENLADNMFLMNAIRSINIEPFLVGGGRAKLNADVLMKLEVIIPLKSEQQKIGAFFKQLDDTIALHQRKLDLLKETKKGFLQKMFV